MKTYKLRLSPVEEEMLKEIQKANKRFRNIEALVLGLIQKEYAENNSGRGKTK